jgi:DNA-binding SARP family transcriptional activator
MVEFRILGPFEVSSEGDTVPLGGGRQRAVLALLLLRLGEVVSSDQLLEELWAGRPPVSATKVVQNYVSRLRKRLGEGVLLTRAPGYVLRADPQSLDAHRFERLFEEGRRLLAGGDPVLAATALREALSLWRGPALADFLYEPFAQGEIARLEDLRLACLEERIEAELQLGSHAELTGELEALVGEHPLRERLWGQLMLALYRSGRQAEALAAYQLARQTLVEELGIEPSRLLQGLEKAILNQEPELDLPAVARPATASVPTRVEPVHVWEATWERKLATAVFVDLVGSTELGEGDPERTRVMLERFYDAMASEIEAAGGTVEKLAGDVIMAIFGAPAAQEDHAVRALHAALAMRERLAELFGDDLALHIGVDTGEVVVALPREGSSFATGNAVNVAARLEQAAAAGEIFVGESTVAAARGVFVFGEPMIVEAKGKRGAVACCRLLGELSLERPRGVGELPRAFVGRESELELLRATYRRAVREGQPHLLTIMGEAGVGKTTLMRELWGELHEEAPAVRPLTGRCLAYGRGITYWPLGEILRQQLGLREGDPAETVLGRLGDRRILGLTLGLDVAGELHPLEAREALHAAWVELLGELAADRPCVVLVEDLHWAEEPLLDLFERLLRDVRGTVFLLGTARPELLGRRPAWAGGRRNAVNLWLEPLSHAETGEMVASLLGTELDPSLAELVLGRAEGNPFFVEELLATLIDRGVLERENGGWVARELASDTIVPDSIRATLASRIDLLPAREKAALQAASVAGRVFWGLPVSELVGEEPDWALLEERDFIRQQRVSSLAGEREFWIKHALTREVAYASLPKARRARFHAAFAAWTERAGGPRDEHAPFLAHHYAEAVRPEDVDLAWPGEGDRVVELREHAVAWSRRAAQLAVGRYAIDEALALLHQAVALESQPDAQADLWQEIGHANALQFDGEACRAAMEKAIELGGPSGELYTELALQTARRSGMWKQPPNRVIVDGWIDQALELAEEGSSMHAKALAAAALWRRDETAARALHAIALRLGDVDLRSNSLAALTDVAWSAGDLESAQEWLEERLQLVPELSDPDDCHFAQMTAVCAYLVLGRLPEAARACEQLESLVEGLTPHHRMHAVTCRLGVETVRGRWNVVRELTPIVEQTVKANATAPCCGNAEALLDCALASLHSGDEAESDRLEAEAAAQTLEGAASYYYAHWLRLMLAHTDLPGLERLVGSFDLDSVSDSNGRFDLPPAVIDALVALHDLEAIEMVAPRWLRPGTYAEPFAIRALGVARRDAELLDEASRRFQTIGLDWRVKETQRWREENMVA